MLTFGFLSNKKRFSIITALAFVSCSSSSAKAVDAESPVFDEEADNADFDSMEDGEEDLDMDLGSAGNDGSDAPGGDWKTKENIRLIFETLVDVEGKGSFKAEDLVKATLALRYNEAKSIAAAELPSIDEDKDGLVSEEELQKAYGQQKNAKGENRVAELIPLMMEANDLNGDGKLDVDEFAGMFGAATEKMKKITASEEVRARDTDGDGKVSLQEFILAEHPEYVEGEDKVAPEVLEVIQKEFERYDINPKDGFLTEEEMLDFATRENEIRAAAEELIDQVDIDRDGSVTFAELLEDETKREVRTAVAAGKTDVDPMTNFEFVANHPLLDDWAANSGSASGNNYGDEGNMGDNADDDSDSEDDEVAPRGSSEEL